MSNISVFCSYSHRDNGSYYGRLVKIFDDINSSYESLSGNSVDPFRDTESIKLGEKWRERLDAGLASSTILLAFISTSYLLSAACRSELNVFLSMTSKKENGRLIIPLLLQAAEGLNGKFAGDELWEQIKELQYLSIASLRTQDPGSGEWMAKILAVAERMDAILLSEVDPYGIKFPEPAIAAEMSAEISANAQDGGRLELLARAEDEMVAINSPLIALGRQIEEYGSVAEVSTPRMNDAKSFKERLLVANDIARNFDKVSDLAEPIGEQIKASLYVMNPGMITLIRIVVDLDESEWNSEQVQTFVQSTRSLAMQALDASKSTEKFSESVKGVSGYSGPLDRAIERIIRILDVMVVDARTMFQTWLDELGRRETGGE